MNIAKHGLRLLRQWPGCSGHLYYSLVIILASGLLSCGGKAAQNTGPHTPCYIFPVWVAPERIEIAQGSSETVAVGLNGYLLVPGPYTECTGFFTSPATVQVSGLPAGVTVSAASLVITVQGGPPPGEPPPQGGPLPLTFSVSASATPASTTLTLTGTSSTMTASTSLSLSVIPANPLTSTPTCRGSTPPPAPNPNPAPNEWTWESGSNAVDQPGVYGTKGVASASNIPGARVGTASWTDSSGNFWLLGGYGLYSSNAANQGDLNDLWEYSGGEWTWMGGSNSTEQAGVYGTLGVPATSNVPGARYLAASWTDTSGNFWLFGGLGLDSAGTRGDLNDLWKYEPATGMWTWMGGPKSLCNIEGDSACAGVYGIQGVSAQGNAPGSRTNASSWTDSCGNLWLFGGDGWDSTGTPGILNDLWKYEPVNSLWTWVSGANIADQNGTYGALGTPNPGNVPGSRSGAVTWIDLSGDLWLFGGEGSDWNGIVCLDTLACDINDLWKYDPTTNTWTWMGGPDVTGQSGVYGTKGTPAAGNVPGGRDSALAWTDPQGNFWLFGGTGYDFRTNPLYIGDLNDLWMYDPANWHVDLDERVKHRRTTRDVWDFGYSCTR